MNDIQEKKQKGFKCSYAQDKYKLTDSLILM